MSGIKITDVVVYPIKKRNAKSKLSAFAKVVLNDTFIINGVHIYEGVNGAFIKFPQDSRGKTKDGKPYDICYPITAELRTYISDQVLAEYALTVTVEKAK